MPKYELPDGFVRICAGLVQAADHLPPVLRDAIRNAEKSIGHAYTDEALRQCLIKAVKLSLVNRQEWPFERLNARYGLAISLHEFIREKRRFCWALARELGLI